MKTQLAALSALLLTAALAGCGGSDEPSESATAAGAPAKQERPLVVATTTQLGDIVRQVAGDGA